MLSPGCPSGLRTAACAGHHPRVSEPPPPVPSPQHSTRCWTLCSADGAVDVEVVVHDENHHGSVLGAVARELGLPLAGPSRRTSRLPDDLPLSSRQLAHAAVLGLSKGPPLSCRDER